MIFLIFSIFHHCPKTNCSQLNVVGSDDAYYIKDVRNAAAPAGKVIRRTPPLMTPDPDCWVVPLKFYE